MDITNENLYLFDHSFFTSLSSSFGVGVVSPAVAAGCGDSEGY